MRRAVPGRRDHDQVGRAGGLVRGPLQVAGRVADHFSRSWAAVSSPRSTDRDPIATDIPTDASRAARALPAGPVPPSIPMSMGLAFHTRRAGLFAPGLEGVVAGEASACSHATSATPTRQPSPPETTEICGVDNAATAPASKSPRRGPPVTTAVWTERQPASERLWGFELEDRVPEHGRDDVRRPGERQQREGRRPTRARGRSR